MDKKLGKSVEDAKSDSAPSAEPTMYRAKIAEPETKEVAPRQMEVEPSSKLTQSEPSMKPMRSEVEVKQVEMSEPRVKTVEAESSGKAMPVRSAKEVETEQPVKMATFEAPSKEVEIKPAVKTVEAEPSIKTMQVRPAKEVEAEQPVKVATFEAPSKEVEMKPGIKTVQEESNPREVTYEVGQVKPMTEVKPAGELPSKPVYTLEEVDTGGIKDPIKVPEKDPVDELPGKGIKLFDFVEVKGAPTSGSEVSTDEGSIISGRDVIEFSNDTNGLIRVGDTAVIDGVKYEVTNVSQFSGEVTHVTPKTDELTEIRETAMEVTEVRGAVLQLSDGRGEVIEIAAPYDYAGDLPDISNIDFTSVLPAGKGGISTSLLDQNQVVTVGEGADEDGLTVHDMNSVDFMPVKSGQVQSVENGQLNSVQDSVSFDVDDPSRLTLGDTTTIDGVTYTVTSISHVSAKVSYDDPDTKGDDVTEIKGAAIELTAPNDASIEFVIPFDPIGDLENITAIEYGGIYPTKAVSAEDLDSNETVTLGEAAPEQVKITDLIQLGEGPGSGSVQSVSDGGLIEVDEPILFTQSEPGYLLPGDTAIIDGVEYKVVETGQFEAKVDYDDPSTKGLDQINIKGGLVRLDDGDGNTIDYALPHDGNGDLPNITQISYGSVSGGKIKLQDNDFDDDQEVTLAEAPPNTVDIHDMIQVNGLPIQGQVGETADGDLIEVDDPITFTTATPNVIQVGDTAEIDGVTYTVTASGGFKGEVTYDDPTTLGPDTTTAKGGVFELKDDDGNTVEYVVPYDQSGDLPDIQSISYDYIQVGSSSWNASYFDEDQNVTLEAPPVQLHDLIQVNSSLPGAGDSLTVGNELIEVDEPVGFTTANPGYVSVGDTTVIDGTTYIVSSTQVQAVEVSYNGGDDDTVIKLYTLELTDGSETFTYYAPLDNTGDLPDITEIKVLQVGTPGVSVSSNSLDEDDNVTLAEPNTIDIHDMIQLDGLPVQGQVGTTNDGDLIEVDEPITFTTADPNLLQVGDTAVVDGVTYTITSSGGFKGEVTYDDPNTPGTETTIIKGGVFELTDDDGNTLEYAVPYDHFDDLPNIESISYDYFGMNSSQWQTSYFDEDDNVTLAEPTCDLFDLIEVGGPLPGIGDNLSVSGGELVEVDEPVSFSSATAGQVNVGDTTTIGGTTFTVTTTQVQAVQITYNGGADDTVVKLYTMELSDGTNTFTYYAPIDSTGDLPDITQIQVIQVGSPGVSIYKSNLDDDDDVSLVCFGHGTLIVTDQGEQKVERLAVGDKVLTQDNGFQTIRWIGAQSLSGRGKFAPIVIRQGALGNSRDLKLSPQHRVLIKDGMAELLFGETEYLVAAKHLVDGKGITIEPCAAITYYHLLFDTHELIFSEGIATESFHPGAYSMGTMADDTKSEILELFPELADADDYGDAARGTLKPREVLVLRGMGA